MKDKQFKELLDSVKEAGEIMHGKRKPSRIFYVGSRIKEIRSELGQSQSEFAELLRIPVSTLRNWEQGRRIPQGPAQSLLTIVEHLPKQSLKVLRQSV
ncbi:MAG TPA: helix-turn-helix domain-containing protein [Candidatus Kapabacteria bacterium]|nr:helix-turn-helix domain-containing protein [Candidatus Kapabacteria bacterium]